MDFRAAPALRRHRAQLANVGRGAVEVRQLAVLTELAL